MAVGEQLGLVVGLAFRFADGTAAFEILAVKSYGAVHCLNRILDDDDPRYISTGDLILVVNCRMHPTTMIRELMCSRCVLLTLAKPRGVHAASAVHESLSAPGGSDEGLTVFTPLQLFSPTPESPRSLCDEILEPDSSPIVYSDCWRLF